MIIKQTIEDDFIVYATDTGAIIKTPIQQETAGQVIELPENPIIKLQNQVLLMQQALDDILLNGGEL